MDEQTTLTTPAQGTPQIAPQPARIVIVDDHPNTASMLARVLKKLDTPAEILVANSGEEALQLIGSNVVEVLITDFIMPGMSGLELVERLKKEDHEPGHIILMTAYDMPGLTFTTRQLKIQDFLVKPVDPDKIRGIVEKVLKQLHPVSETAQLDQSLAAEAPPKILIADDNPDNIRLLAVRLQSEGYHFITASDGQQTLDLVNAENPDLVLLDVNMPNKDGFEVLTEMRANENVAHIPVIIITAARIGIKDVREGLTLGADDYITKPFDWRELSARIRTKLRVKKAEDSLRQRSKNLGVLPEISLDLGERLDVEALTKTILARTVGALEAANGYLFIFQPDGSASFQMHEVHDLPAWTNEEERNRMISDIIRPSEGVVAQVVANRQGQIIANTERHEGWFRIQRDETQSAILVPLLGREEVLGVLTLTHNQVGYFKPDHLTLLQAIASQSAIAIENAQLYAAERRRVNELVALNQLTREISRFTRSTELWENLPRLARETLRYPAVGLWLVDGDKADTDHPLTLRGLAGQENAPRHSILEVAPLQAAETGQPAQFSGPIEERSSERAGTGKPPVVSVIAVPLIWNQAVRGVFSVHSQRAGAFQESDRVVLETLASQITSALERIQLFESVEHEQRRLSAVLRSAADAILVFDTQGSLLLANPAGQRLFTDIQAQVGQPLPVDSGYEDLTLMLDGLRKENTSGQGEIPWPDKRTFSIVVTPVEDGGQVAILHDVSHFKALDHLKNEFLATASHDLKNPIFAVLGYSDLLSKAGPLNDMQSNFVGRIRNSAVQMQDLVLNLLEIGRMEMGTKLRLENVDLNEVLGNVVEEFRPQADAKGHTITVDLSSAPVQINGDKIRLQQVARNLLGNAIKYTPNGGQITVTSQVEDRLARVSFKDTGLGISEENLPHLFEKFYRVRDDKTQDIEGNGLGLAIVKSIIEQHGGQVQVESVYGKGSCFSINLPLTKGA
jgi:signal transduction histidine kinase/DNA-binding response OmpR family regulator